MESHDDVLEQHLREQIALEEHLCKIIEGQISEIDEKDFADAKNLLIKTSQTLERHFSPLNELLDKLEQSALSEKLKAVSGNGGGILPLDQEQKDREQKSRISKMLCDDYTALNIIAMSNTLLHTTALALNCQEVATIALTHLGNLTPLVVRLGELLPEVVARELRYNSPKVDLSVAQTALKNAQLAWRKAT